MDIAYGYVGRRVLHRQTFVEPCQRGGNHGILIAQPVNELDRECLRKRLALVRSQNNGGGFRGLSARTKQPIGDSVGEIPLGTARGNLLCEAPKIFNQNDPKSDRNRPEFTYGERLYFLISPDETNQHLGVETAIRMGDEGPRDSEHSGIAHERAISEFRELTIVSRR